MSSDRTPRDRAQEVAEEPDHVGVGIGKHHLIATLAPLGPVEHAPRHGGGDPARVRMRGLPAGTRAAFFGTGAATRRPGAQRAQGYAVRLGLEGPVGAAASVSRMSRVQWNTLEGETPSAAAMRLIGMPVARSSRARARSRGLRGCRTHEHTFVSYGPERRIRRDRGSRTLDWQSPAAPSSSGQDRRLSRVKRGFDSRRGHRRSLGSIEEATEPGEVEPSIGTLYVIATRRHRRTLSLPHMLSFG